MATKSYSKTSAPPTKFERVVRPYKRKVHNRIVKVRGYKQGYVVPRGPVKNVMPDKMTKHSQTMWLMDKYGRFIGRANYEGETSATGIYKFGFDETRAVRDAKKYKRVFGRLQTPRRRVMRR